MNKVIANFKPSKVVVVPGAGNKFVHMATGKSSLYLNFVRGLKLWDTCAGDALLKSRFGTMTNTNLEHIDYTHRHSNFTVEQGIVACRSPQSLNANISRFRQGQQCSIVSAYKDSVKEHEL